MYDYAGKVIKYPGTSTIVEIDKLLNLFNNKFAHVL